MAPRVSYLSLGGLFMHVNRITVTTDKLSVLLDWARQWNKDILKDNGNDHLAFENFPAMVQQQEQNK